MEFKIEMNMAKLVKQPKIRYCPYHGTMLEKNKFCALCDKPV
jgi:hypothetical protein